MEIVEAMKTAIKEMIVPEINKVKSDVGEIKAVLGVTNKRIDDIVIQLSDLNRKIDSVREELSQRIDDTNKRIDSIKEKLDQKIDDINSQIESLNKELSRRIDFTNSRLDRLFEIIVRREEHTALGQKVFELEKEVREIRSKIGV